MMYAYEICKHAGITNRQRYYWTQLGILKRPVVGNETIRNGYHATEAFKAALANYLIKNTAISVQALPDFFKRLKMLVTEERVLADCILILTWTHKKPKYKYEISLCHGRYMRETENTYLAVTTVDMHQFWPERY